MIFQKELTRCLQAGRERTAIEHGDKTVSYAGLLALSDAITAYFCKAAIPAQTYIGIFTNDRTALISTLIGIANARCVFVPIDPALPESRLAVMVQELDLKHVVVQPYVRIPTPFQKLARHSYEDMVGTGETVTNYPAFDADDSLYVYFTSGTTGKPKGIMGRNASLLHFLTWQVSEFNIDNTARFSQLISPYFDAFLRDVFTPLLAGGTICIPPADDDFLTSDKLTQWIDQERVTHIHCVPSMFRVISHQKPGGNIFKSLKYIFMSGEKIVPSTLENWYNEFGSAMQLVNFYGATETTMIRSSYRIQPTDVSKVRIPVGKPMTGTEFVVLNKDMKPCGVCIVGDLYVVTDFMTKGYLNAPDLNREKFVEINLAGVQRKAFKSGDKARRLADGNFELLGREDRQIKLLGVRVELDDIENVMLKAPGVKQVAVVQDTAQQANDRLIAFVIGDKTQCSVTLEQYLQKQLPTYMIPSIIGVTEFPLLPNGKINYNDLIRMASIRPETIVEPANDVEQKLVGIWQEILGNKPISTESSFQHIGGNSLAMMRLIGKIYKEFAVRMSLSQLFNNLTIKLQAQLIQRADKDAMMTIGVAEKKKLYALSAAQERIYFTHQLDETSTAYNLPMVWEIHGDVNEAQIESVINQLVARHESLRSQFVFEGDRVFQTVCEPTIGTLVRLSCGDTPEEIRNEVDAFIKPFDLATDPLFRAALLRAGSHRRIIVIDTHHIACDGMSQTILLNEFVQLFDGVSLSPLKIQYKDYAEWERKFMQTSDYLAHREFWLKKFESGIPKLQLPRAKSNGHGAQGASLSFAVEGAAMAPIREALREQEITDFSGLFTLYFLLLCQISGQDDIVIGTNTTGRTQDELMGIVGMFVKTLPIRLQPDPDLSFIENAKQVHLQLVEAHSRQIYDLADIVSGLKLKGLGAASDMFDAVFVFQNFEETVKPQRAQFTEVDFDNGTCKYALTLFAAHNDKGFQFRLEYATNVFTTRDAALLAEKFATLVERISESIQGKIIDHWSDESDAAVAVEKDEVKFNF